MAQDRQTTREALATEAAAYVTSAQAIYDYKPDDANGQFPILAFESSGSARTRVRFQGTHSVFAFNAHILVLYADPDQSWTKANADDAVDAMEHELATFIEAKPHVDGKWKNLQQVGPSVILDTVMIGGDRYIDEVVPLVCEVY